MRVREHEQPGAVAGGPAEEVYGVGECGERLARRVPRNLRAGVRRGDDLREVSLAASSVVGRRPRGSPSFRAVARWRPRRGRRWRRPLACGVVLRRAGWCRVGAGIVLGMFVKVCGLRTAGDVRASVDAGADAVGFVFAESVRRVSVAEAKRLAEDIPDGVLTVGVFKGISAEDAAEMTLAAGMGAVQLHGDYPEEAFAVFADLPVRVIRANVLTAETDVRVGAFGEDLLLLDSKVAGSGEQWDLGLLDNARPEGRWILAGGLRPETVASAIAAARPWGVDVSSGVESSRGVKDPDLIRAFVAAAQSARV